MLRTALALLSTLQIGARIKDSVERSLRQATVIAVACGVAHRRFGLRPRSQPIRRSCRSISSTPLRRRRSWQASSCWIGLIVLAIVPSMGRPPKEAPTPSRLTSTADPAAMIDQGVGKAMQQVGPVPVLVAAFLAGIFAGRR